MCKKHSGKWSLGSNLDENYLEYISIMQYNAMCSKNGIFGLTSIHKGVTSIHKKRVKKRYCCMGVKFLWMEVNLASSIRIHHPPPAKNAGTYSFGDSFDENYSEYSSAQSVFKELPSTSNGFWQQF